MSTKLGLPAQGTFRLPEGCTQAEIKNQSQTTDGAIWYMNRPDDTHLDPDPPTEKTVPKNSKFKINIGSGNRITLANTGDCELVIEY